MKNIEIAIKALKEVKDSGTKEVVEEKKTKLFLIHCKKLV
jgi:hypothetical protein